MPTWFYAKDDGSHVGPMSEVQLRQLAQQGTITPQTLVWRDGLPNWVAAGKVRGLFDAPGQQGGGQPAQPSRPGPAAPQQQPGPSPANGLADTAAAPRRPGPPQPRAGGGPAPAPLHSEEPSPFFIVGVFDSVLRGLRGIFPDAFVRMLSNALSTAGLFGAFGLIAVAFAWRLGVAIEAEQYARIADAVIHIFVMLVLLYTAGKFIDVGNRFVAESEAKLTNAGLIDAVALLSLIAAVAVLVEGITACINQELLAPLWPALGMAGVLLLIGLVAMHPSLMNAHIERGGSIGEEAVSLLSYLLKAAVRLAPMLLGFGVLFATFMICYEAIRYFAGVEPAGNFFLGDPEFVQQWRGSLDNTLLYYSGTIEFWIGVGARALLAPLIIYLVFLIYHLLVDLVRATLVLPGKLDTVAQKQDLQIAKDVEQLAALQELKPPPVEEATEASEATKKSQVKKPKPAQDDKDADEEAGNGGN